MAEIRPFLRDPGPLAPPVALPESSPSPLPGVCALDDVVMWLLFSSVPSITMLYAFIMKMSTRAGSYEPIPGEIWSSSESKSIP